MTKILSYFNPNSTEFHSIQDFKKLNKQHQVITVLASAAFGLITLGLGAIPAFRFLVGRFTKRDPRTLPVAEKKVKRALEAALLTPPSASAPHSYPAQLPVSPPPPSIIEFPAEVLEIMLLNLSINDVLTFSRTAKTPHNSVRLFLGTLKGQLAFFYKIAKLLDHRTLKEEQKEKLHQLYKQTFNLFVQMNRFTPKIIGNLPRGERHSFVDYLLNSSLSPISLHRTPIIRRYGSPKAAFQIIVAHGTPEQFNRLFSTNQCCNLALFPLLEKRILQDVRKSHEGDLENLLERLLFSCRGGHSQPEIATIIKICNSLFEVFPELESSLAFQKLCQSPCKKGSLLPFIIAIKVFRKIQAVRDEELKDSTKRKVLLNELKKDYDPISVNDLTNEMAAVLANLLQTTPDLTQKQLLCITESTHIPPHYN